MENKAHALAAGIFVVVVAALLLALAAWLTRDTGQRDVYEISTRETVTGLQAQAPVRYRGIDVGKVEALGFDPRAPGNVLVRLSVDREAPVTQGTFATLSFQGVTGLAFVQLDDEGQPAPPLQPKDGEVPRIPLRPGLISKLTERGEVILEQVAQITTRLNQVLADPNQKRLAGTLDNLGQAAADISKLSSNMTTILNAQLGPERVSIPAFVKDADAAVRSLRETSDQARTTLAEVGRATQQLNAPNGPLQRLSEGTAALSQAAESFSTATLPRINRATEDTSRAVRQLSRTVTTINDNPQSLIFGSGAVEPGPGERGFEPPGDE